MPTMWLINLPSPSPNDSFKWDMTHKIAQKLKRFLLQMHYKFCHIQRQRYQWGFVRFNITSSYTLGMNPLNTFGGTTNAARAIISTPRNNDRVIKVGDGHLRLPLKPSANVGSQPRPVKPNQMQND